MARRPKGAIEHQTTLVCNDFVMGVLEFDAPKPCLTPSTIALIIGEREIEEAATKKLAPEFGPPSAGAITNVLKKWERTGFGVMMVEPYGFVTYGDVAYEDGVQCADDIVRMLKKAGQWATSTSAPSQATAPTAGIPRTATALGNGEITNATFDVSSVVPPRISRLELNFQGGQHIVYQPHAVKVVEDGREVSTMAAWPSPQVGDVLLSFEGLANAQASDSMREFRKMFVCVDIGDGAGPYWQMAQATNHD